MAVEGLVTTRSDYGPEETVNRLEAAVRAKGMMVFAQIDHALGAAAAGLALRPTKMIIFGSASSGTPLMQSNQTMGIDLPLKMLVWQDEEGSTFLSFNDLDWVSRRHGLDTELSPNIDAIKLVISAIVYTVAFS